MDHDWHSEGTLHRCRACDLAADSRFVDRDTLPPCGAEHPRAAPAASFQAAPRARLRVGLVSPVFATGGVERQILGMVKHTSSAIQWTGMALTEKPATDPITCSALAQLMPMFSGPDLADGDRNSPIGIQRLPSTAAAIRRVAEKSDVLICWGIQELGHYLKDYHGAIVVVSHGSCDWTKAWLHGALKVATHFVAVSKAAARVYPASLQENVWLIPNGIELDRCSPCRSRDDNVDLLGLREARPVVSYIGRFSPEKNPLSAARAVGELRRRNIPAVALYHGRGWNEAEFRDDVERLAGGHVRWADQSWRVGDVLAVSNCVLTCAAEEGGPLVALEAMAAGVPLVSTRTGTIAELADDGLDIASLVPAGATDSQLADAVIDATWSDQRGYSSGRVERAQTAVWQWFTAAAMAHRWETFLLNEVAGVLPAVV